ncbi:MAG: helix-turn-helix transcriptional regulator, partial [Hyphomicrobiales bacterium]|nr:helix-turn-helix transcriptional regulator [Hyphomicrobiales bacterium]
MQTDRSVYCMERATTAPEVGNGCFAGVRASIGQDARGPAPHGTSFCFAVVGPMHRKGAPPMNEMICVADPADLAALSPRERLILAATRLFCAHGIAATGVDAVLREAGVAKMTLYKLFG